MIEFLVPLAIITLISAISLGIGSSSLAIASFLTALADSKIDTSERRMLGVIYIMLRFSMVSILLMTIFLSVFEPEFMPNPLYQWILVAVLYVNAILMTLHWMPVRFGPAIQAATWYTLGFHFTIDMLGLYEMTTSLFLWLYAIDFITVFIIVNGFLWYVKKYVQPEQKQV